MNISDQSKIALVTDTHQGARNSSKVFRDYAKAYWADEFFPEIEKREIKTILHLGDFFDSRNSVSLHDIDYVMNEWIPMLERSGAVMYVIAGNHDVAYRNTNAINSLALLKSSDNIVVIDNEIQVLAPFEDGPKFVMCPWINNENYEDLMEDLKTYATKEHILCMHGEFKGMKMYKTSKVCDHGLEPDDFKKYLRVFSGHFHHPSVYGNIEYMGALFYFNWQDYNDPRGWMIYDNDEAEFIKIENTSCPFAMHAYEDVKDWTDEDLKNVFSNKISRLTITEAYDKVELKDLIHKIESNGPVSVDVIDNTILEKVIDNDDDTPDNVKEISEYVDDALSDNPKKDDLSALFDSIYTEALSRMKEIE